MMAIIIITQSSNIRIGGTSSTAIAGMSNCHRSINTDYLYYNYDDMIQTVRPTSQGVSQLILHGACSSGRKATPGVWGVYACKLANLSGVKDIFFVFKGCFDADLRLDWYQYD